MTNSTTREPATMTVPAADASAALSHRQILTILSGLLLGIFLAALDQNIVSVAIVKIANSLHGFDQQAWATTAYLITATISTPLYGKLADIYGRKPYYLAAIGLFVVGSAACTFAGTMYQLAGFRAFQGLGAGGLMSLAFTIIGDIVPARERVRYQGYFMMVFGSATVLGPVLGGLFSDYDRLWGLSGWRWVFLVNVPVGALALVVVARVLDVPHLRQRHRVDWFGAVLLAVCVVPLLIVAEQGRGWGWTSHRALLCYGIAAGGLLLFLLVEFLMRDAALIPLRLFRNSTFSVTILGGFIVGIAMFGAISMVPLYLQVVRGFSPTKSGLLMLPLVLGIMIGSQLAGQLTRITGRYKIQPVLGTFVIAVGAVAYAQVRYNSPMWQPLCYSLVIGFGLGGCMQTLITAAQNAGPRSDMGVSTATATFCRQMGGTLGVAVFLTIMFNLLPHRIVAAFGGHLPPGFDAAQLSRIQSNTSGIVALPAAVRRPILVGFTDSLHGVFYAAAGVSLAACLVLMFMKEIPLQDVPPRSGEDIPVREHLHPDPPSRPAPTPSRPRISAPTRSPSLSPAAVLDAAHQSGTAAEHQNATAPEYAGGTTAGYASGTAPEYAGGTAAEYAGGTAAEYVSGTAAERSRVAAAQYTSASVGTNSSGITTQHQHGAAARGQDGTTATHSGGVATSHPTGAAAANLGNAAAHHQEGTAATHSEGVTASRPIGAAAENWGSAAARHQDDPVAGHSGGAAAPDSGGAAVDHPGGAGAVYRDGDAAAYDSGHFAAADTGAAHSIGGHIRREDGHPVPAAVLTLIDPHGRQVARAMGRSDGEYRVAAPDHGNYVLIVSALGHRPAAVTITLAARPQTLDVTLPGAAEVSGVVRSAGRGEPLPGATVTLTDADGEVIDTVVTGDDGRYLCHGVVPGHYTLVAVARHLRPAAATLTVPDTGLLHHDLELAAMAVLAGSAWADGRAVPDAEVTVFDVTGTPIATARTDESGHYLVTDLPEGDYTVVARGYPPVHSHVTVSGGEVGHDVWLGYDASV